MEQRFAREALLHAWSHAYVGRKQRKRGFRALWQTRIAAGARANGLSYSKLTAALKKKNIVLDRKILAALASEHPDVFRKVVELAK
jgi:large subunit ribosomal protein L20